MHRAWIVWITALMVIPLSPGNFSIGSDDLAGDTEGPQVYICADASEARLDQLGIQIDETYSGFVTLHATQETEGALWRAGISFFEISGRDEVALPGASFTLLSSDLALKGTDRLRSNDGLESYLILKFKGPVKADWLDEVRSTGAITVGGPLSHYNIIVKTGKDGIHSLAALPFVRWLGELLPQHKLPYPLPSSGNCEFDMVFFKEAPADYSRALELVEACGGRIVERDDATAWWNSAVVDTPAETASSILDLPGLWTLETVGEAGPRNDLARWVIQSFDAGTNATPYWDAGITGNGIVVGLADSGIDYDHIAFRDKWSDYGSPGPDHRKIVRYNSSLDDWDQLGHGTHVAGSLAGDSIQSPNIYDKDDGMAYGAKISFYDIVDANGSWDPPLIRGILQDAYDVGARIHSDSWGDDRYEYTLRAQRMDQFQWDYPDFLTFVAAGNVGPGPNTVQEPATAKSIVAVGAALNGNSTSLASFSSHGPTQEGLIAPTLVAPGSGIRSAASDGQKATYNDQYKYMSGTSMATPVAAGACVLVEQYFRDGFYPNGRNEPAYGFQPSGPLKKAVLVASGNDQSGGDNVQGHNPDFAQGWGKVKLSDALYLESYNRSRRLWLEDYYNDSHINDGLATGESRIHRVTVNSSMPLKIVLAWNDWPGAGIVNDLNLEVTAPNGTLYRGNQFVNGTSVQSNNADTVNTVESVIINNPARGMYQVKVTAMNIGNGSRQRYSIVATGDLFDSSVGMLRLDRERTGLNATVGVELVDSDLRGMASVNVNVTSGSETAPETVALAEDGITGIFSGTLILHSGAPMHDGVIQVKDGDTVKVSYEDANPSGPAWATVLVDGSPPRIRSFVLENVTNTTAVIRLETYEISTVIVQYWTKLSGWEQTGLEAGFKHSIELGPLYPRTDYFLDLSLEDSYGNSVLQTFDGNHTKFRTYDLDYRPAPGFAGAMSYGVDTNFFEGEGISVGMSGGNPRIGGFRLDTPDVPNGAAVQSAQLRLMPLDTRSARTESNWLIELLADGSEVIFDGTSQHPNYTSLKDANGREMIADSINGTSIKAGSWQVIDLTPTQCAVLTSLAAHGAVCVRITGPLSGPDSLLEWYSGRSPETVFYAPQLAIVLDYPPKVYPWATAGFSMNEDGVDNSSVNFSMIFYDEETLSHDSPTHYETSGANITVNISKDGTATFRPKPNWNGVENVELRATDPLGLSASYVVSVIVRAVNDPPRLVTVGGLPAEDGLEFTARQGDTFTTTVLAQDPDVDMEGEHLFFVTNDTLVRFLSPRSTVISFTPSNDDVGRRTVRVSVRDSDYEASVSVIFDIQNVNDPPVATLDWPQTGEVFDNQTLIRFLAYGTVDLDVIWGDELSYIWDSNISGVIGHGRELNATLVPGRHHITLTVVDSSGLISVAAADIRVDAVVPPLPPIIPPPNVPPVQDDTGELPMRFMVLTMVLIVLLSAWLFVTPRPPRPPNVRPTKGTIKYTPPGTQSKFFGKKQLSEARPEKEQPEPKRKNSLRREQKRNNPAEKKEHPEEKIVRKVKVRKGAKRIRE